MDAAEPVVASPVPAPLTRHYRPPAATYDELVAADGSIRPHWMPLVQALDGMGSAERGQRWEGIARRLRDHGVSYHVYDDPRGVIRPWTLDPVPLLLPPDEWATIERGLTQRARLLELVLHDLYGPRHLLREGLLPPELLFGNPGFLLPCHGTGTAADRWLVLYAADLGRAADGGWQVLSDRTQSPSGAGYALENRIALASALPEAFAAMQVPRLAGYFAAVRDTLARLAPRPAGDPRVVLLTPGPLNETYFEHAFLARYLGYTLAEGADLTVRDGAVFLNVLGGLQPVDVILRRLDDDYCDPLELRGNSSLGVPGLVHAVRTRRVAIANALGAGVVEMPALLPFLPGMCRRLLGEDLRLPSAVTWWCGTPSVREHVLAHLDRMVVKPAFPAVQREPIFGRLLDRAQREALAHRIRAQPVEFVAQEEVALATAPVLDADRLRPRHVGTRCYLVATDDGYAIMPGGLTRVASAEGTRVVSMQRGGASKDTWVLSPVPVRDISLLDPVGQPVTIVRDGHCLPSRVADNLFWLGRYTARCEGIVRVLRCVLGRRTERVGLGAVGPTSALLRGLSTMTGAQVAPGVQGGARIDGELFAVLFDAQRAGGLREAIHALGRAARTVRDRIAWDAWRLIAGLDAAFVGRRASGPRRPAEALDRLDIVLMRLTALDGFVVESMTRGEIWHFLDMGRRLERATQLVRLLRGALSPRPDAEPAVLEAVLDFADSLMTYRRRYQSRMQAHAVLDLLITDDSNPRSVLFNLHEIERHVRALPRDGATVGMSAEERVASELLLAARVVNVENLAAVAVEDERPALITYASNTDHALAALSDIVSQRYLTQTQLPRQLRRFDG